MVVVWILAGVGAIVIVLFVVGSCLGVWQAHFLTKQMGLTDPQKDFWRLAYRHFAHQEGRTLTGAELRRVAMFARAVSDEECLAALNGLVSVDTIVEDVAQRMEEVAQMMEKVRPIWSGSK